MCTVRCRNSWGLCQALPCHAPPRPATPRHATQLVWPHCRHIRLKDLEWGQSLHSHTLEDRGPRVMRWSNRSGQNFVIDVCILVNWLVLRWARSCSTL